MSVISLLSGLEKLGISLQVVKDDIKVNAPKGRLKKELIDELRVNKKELVKFLQAREKKRLDYTTIDPEEEKEYYVLSPAQKRLYIVQQMKTNNISYNLPNILPLEQTIEKEKLEGIFKTLINRHESLRTSFITIEGEPYQRINAEVKFEIGYYDLQVTGAGDRCKWEDEGTRGLAPLPIEPPACEQVSNAFGGQYPKSQELRAKSFISSFIRPFDISRAPLLRIGLIKAGETGEILLLDMHHIVTDGTSQNILIEEFRQLYSGNPLPVPVIRYRDYTRWLNRPEHQERIKQQKTYWRQVFSEEWPVLNLPLDFPRPGRKSFEGSTVYFTIAPGQTRQLKKIAKETGATLYMILLALVNILLSRLSGSEDIIVGTPAAARGHPNLRNIIGMFVNILAIRNFPHGTKTFTGFIKEIKEQIPKAYENQEYPFEDLVDQLLIHRDTSRNPLFDVMLVLTEIPDEPHKTPGKKNHHHKEKTYQYENKTAKFDMTFEILAREEQLHIRIEYCTRLFKQRTIERYTGYIRQTVASVIENPDRKLASIEILPAEEKNRILHRFNHTGAAYPKDKLIHQLFQEQAGKTPAQTALTGPRTGRETPAPVKVIGGIQLSYEELNRKSHQMAAELRDKGVKTGAIVAIMMERSVEMVMGLLGILKAGGAYLPIDPEYPQERINFMLKDSGAEILLKDDDFTPEAFNICPKGASSHLHQPPAPATSLAYIIYTSGTTGSPKGVLIEHRNVVRLMLNDKFFFDFNHADVWTMFHSNCFDFSVWEMYGALLYGGRLLVISKIMARETSMYLDLLKKEQVTVLNQTPSAFYNLMNLELESNEKKLRLRYVIFGGQALQPGRLKGYKAKYPATRLINMYGITETTVHATFKEIRNREIQTKISNIGKPIPTSKIYVIDKYWNLQPIGITGEICVAGDGLARGYLNNPELTAGKFHHNSNRSYRSYMSNIYQSGDLARWQSEGDLEYLGRIDHQVKIRGYRIEMGEIENRLHRHPGVKEAVVQATPDESGDKRLCAYIVPANQVNTAELREHLQQYLPEYMLPSFFLLLDRLPLTPNGKVDTKALPAPGIKTGKEYIAPQTREEMKLARIWSEVLEIREEKISIEDNFFEIGGHSLKAVVMTAKVYKELRVKPPLAEVFQEPTIKGLAVYIAKAARSEYQSIKAEEKKEYYPLSPAQERMFFLNRLEPGSTVYNLPQLVQCQGKLDVTKLQEAITSMIRRHESLRTSIHMLNGEPVQRIHDEVEFEIEYNQVEVEEEGAPFGQVLNVSGDSSPKSQEPRAKSFIYSFIRPFNLSQAPLLRVGLTKIKPGKHILMVDMHHITCDGISHEILVKDFTSIMAGNALAPLRLQYKDYTQWCRGNKEKNFINQQETYWHNEFNTQAEIPQTALSTDFARPGIQGFEGKSLEFSLEREQTRALNNLARTHGLTLYMLCLSLFYIFLYKITGQEDIIVGTPTAGRQHADLEQIIGMFVNTLPLRNFPTGEKTLPEFFREVRARTLEAFENQDYSFAELVETVIKKRDTSRNPLFDIMFTLQKASPRGIEIPGMKLTPYPYETGIAKFDLALYGSETPDKLLFSFEYSTNLFKKETIERYAAYFNTLISSILTSPDEDLGEIEIIPAQEKQRILYEFNKTGTSAPPVKTLHRWIEEQVEKTPDNIALSGPTLDIPGPGTKEKVQITYRHINRQASGLVCLLKKRGLGNDNIAVLKVKRSIEMIIGLLGILKAGAAYLPIDPGYPKNRIDFMMKDSGAKILLTGPEITALSSPTHLHLSPAPVTSLAYIIYTSGSTGKPKGVMVEHANVTAYIHAFYKEFKITTRDTVVQLTSFSFDAFGEEVYPILARGGKIFIPTRTEMMDINRLSQLIAKHQVSIIDSTPLLLKEFNKVARENSENLLESVRLYISGGDILKSGFVDRLLTMGEVYNTYGPTETTICAAYYRLPHSTAAQEQAGNHPPGHVPGIPMGKPINNYRVYILDAGYHPLPIGIRGEICIAGPGLARGYLNNPELTAEKFCLRRPGGLFSRKPPPWTPHKSFSLEGTRGLAPLPGRKTPDNRIHSCNHAAMPSPQSPIYRTGDLARWHPEGNIEFQGRIDHQVKIRGFRVELEEIEKQLLKHKEVKEAVVLLKENRDNRGIDSGDIEYLCAYIVTGNSSFEPAALREYLSGRLPYYMVPTYFIRIEKIPLTPTKKIHRQKLLQYKEAPLKEGKTGTAPGTRLEKLIAAAWQEAIGTDQPGIHDNFFEIGGNSINILKVHDKLKKVLDMDIPVVKLFQYPTIHSLSHCLEGENAGQETPGSQQQLPGPVTSEKGKTGKDIAVIGMAGIFPGAKDINEFWDNLEKGVESIAFFSEEELGKVGKAQELTAGVNYVKAMGVIEGAEYFDAAFFGYTPREAQIMDPQVRMFHQCIWTALEDAAYNPFSYDYRIGLYAGASPNISWEGLIFFSGESKELGGFQVSQLTDKDFMCTRISYKLNLRGPSFNIQTACSTSLVAIHLAVQGLLNGECEIALAGGVTISYPLKSGYNYREGIVMSPDGHCRAFDAASHGMVGGNGAAAAVLKRLENAARDKDHIYAVIKGTAVNNDGHHKVGYTAPSVPGQVEVIQAAQHMANIPPETITYIETHGTGTELGDPVEIEALKLAFNTNKKSGKTQPIKKTCGIGSVKTNIGHLDCAAGAAGFIKTVLALKNRLIPPTLNFNAPNPKLGLEDSPFYVVSELQHWNTKGQPRRAGVSSLGIGGTNAHVVLEEWPDAQSAGRRAQNEEYTGHDAWSQGRGRSLCPPHQSRDYQLILLSAKTPTALEQMTQNLARYLKENPGINLWDVAYTLQAGRRHFQSRRLLSCQSASPAQAAELLAKDNQHVKTFYNKTEDPPVIFLLAGQGSQYVEMGKDLYHSQPVFREEMDRCFRILKSLMGYDLKEILYPGEASGKKKPAPPDINSTEITQPLVFAFEYALARLLLQWGIKPAAMIGYSLGEYIAACLSGVFSLEDALKIIVLRGQLMKKTPTALMLSVPLTEAGIKPHLAEHPGISPAIINGPTIILAGTPEAVKNFEKNMKEKRLICVPINLTHAVHTPLMEPIRQEFEKEISKIKLKQPRIPYISNISGDWIPGEEAVKPGYWGKHLCTAVRFSAGIKTLLKEKHAVFIEIGPGRLLSNIVRHQTPPGEKTGPGTVATVKHPQEKISDNRFLMNRLGELWLYGINIDWPGIQGEEKPSRLSMPTYPFEKTRYWIEESFYQEMVSRKAPGAAPPLITAEEKPAPMPEPPPEPRNFPGNEDEEYTAPRDELEQNISRVWQQYLGFERIGIHANFFKINGDSLTAAQLMTRLQQIYPVEISIQEFFQEPTIAKLAEIIKERLIEKVKSLSEEDIDRMI